MYGTFWALVPALVAIVVALLTKEVYISLFLSIIIGALFVTEFNIAHAIQKVFVEMAAAFGAEYDGGNLAGSGNGGIIIFILELGVLVALMNKAGGANAFGKWAMKKVTTRKGAQIAATGLGCMLFVDDYFGRLANGSIMQPITDKFYVSRSKLAYIVGAVSVSICILMPVSSWASVIGDTIDAGNGTEAFLYTILCNFYPFLMLTFLFVSISLGIDLFGIRKQELTALRTKDVTCGLKATSSDEKIEISGKGTPLDLILPVGALIVSVCCMLFFANTDTNTALACGGCIAIIFTMILYLPRKLMSLRQFTACFGEGFKSIAEVVIILVFAWTLVRMCEALGMKEFIETIADKMLGLTWLLPAIFFLCAMGISFSIGTSWGTFLIMVPIVVDFGLSGSTHWLTIAAVLSGSVFGNQVSPISDTTILSASACKANHLEYVKAQMPTALIIAAIALLSFLAAGLSDTVWVGWIVAIVLLGAFITTAYFVLKRKNEIMPNIKLSDIHSDEQNSQVAA